MRRKQAGDCTEAGDNPKRGMHQKDGCSESSDKASSALDPRVAKKWFPK